MLTAWTDTAPRSASYTSRLATSQKSADRSASETRLRIAVADGDERLLEDYRGLLDVLGHEAVSLSQTGKDLLADCHALKPDLVIVESQLPDTDGPTVAAEIVRHRAIPIVLITSSDDGQLIERARRCGVLAAVSKPFRLLELRLAITRSRRCFDQLNAARMEPAGWSALVKRRHAAR